MSPTTVTGQRGTLSAGSLLLLVLLLLLLLLLVAYPTTWVSRFKYIFLSKIPLFRTAPGAGAGAGAGAGRRRESPCQLSSSATPIPMPPMLNLTEKQSTKNEFCKSVAKPSENRRTPRPATKPARNCVTSGADVVCNGERLTPPPLAFYRYSRCSQPQHCARYRIRVIRTDDDDDDDDDGVQHESL